MRKKSKILLLGATGQIGSRAKVLLANRFEVLAPTHQQIDITIRSHVEKQLLRFKPLQILNCVGFTSIDDGPNKPLETINLNTRSLMYLTHTAAKLKIPVHHLSTEVVFDGTKSARPYLETDIPNPLSFLAATKRLGELVILNASPKNSVLRLIICYSPYYPRKMDLARLAISKVKVGQIFKATNDQEINPIYIDHSIAAIQTIMLNRASGIYHLGATNFTTPFKFVKGIVKKLGLDSKLIQPTTFAGFAKTRPEPRPQHEWLDVSKFEKDFGKGILCSVEAGIEAFAEAYRQ